MSINNLIVLLIVLTATNYTEANPHSVHPQKTKPELVEQKRTIILATHIEPPLAYFKNDKLVGSNIEVAQLLAASMNIKLSITHCPFARCLNLLRHGRADIIVGIKKNAERENYLSYLQQPYTTRVTPVRFYLAKQNKSDISNYQDLKNKTIGVLRGATYFKQFDQDSSLNKVEVTTHKQLVDMFLKGRFDTFLGREISISQHVSADTYNNKMKLASYIYKKKNDSYIAISKESRFNELHQAFSEQLDRLIDNGKVKAITKKYINTIKHQ